MERCTAEYQLSLWKFVGKTDKTGTKVTFLPDSDMFGNIKFNFETICNRARELAFLNKGLKIELVDLNTDRDEKYHYEGGISDFVEYLVEGKNKMFSKPIYFEGEDKISIWKLLSFIQTAIQRIPFLL